MKDSKKPKVKGKEGFFPSKPSSRRFLLQSRVFFLTYKGISDNGEKINKESLVNYLLNQNPYDRKVRPEKYLVCEQSYLDGTSHFHAILVYQRRKQILHQGFYDYLGIHPNIQNMRNMKAALDYLYKEDKAPLTNMDLVQEKRVARAKNSSSLYPFLEEQMMKDPFNFNTFKYCLDHNITRQIYKTNYTKAFRLLKQVQQAYCNKLLRDKRGFKFIDRALIQQCLSPQQLLTYDSWPGYQVIVDYLNQIPLYGYKRPLKTKNLLITGAPNSGKTSLIEADLNNTHNSIQRYCSVYPMSAKTWWPNYKSQVYQVISWNEAKLTSFSYDTILKVLEGSKVDLPQKGSSTLKYDNPLVLMTSNMTLQQMILQKFGYSKTFQQMARKNLAVRLQNVVLPEGYTLFLLQKLLTKKD